jgi:hypothetical protein
MKCQSYRLALACEQTLFSRILPRSRVKRRSSVGRVADLAGYCWDHDFIVWYLDTCR